MVETSASLIVTLDGPAGSGKSSVARRLAHALSLRFLDTGAMYRAVAAVVLERYPDLSADDAAIVQVARSLTLRFDWTVDPPTLQVQDPQGGRDLTDRLREPPVTQASSRIAAIAGVRQVLVAAQQRIGREYPWLVTEGRDQGSVVFPQAPVKFYLDARPQVRAKRRTLQLQAAGQPADEAAILQQIIERDQRDSTRADGPLVCPADAIRVETSEMTLDEVLSHLHRTVRQRAADALVCRQKMLASSSTAENVGPYPFAPPSPHPPSSPLPSCPPPSSDPTSGSSACSAGASSPAKARPQSDNPATEKGWANPDSFFRRFWWRLLHAGCWVWMVVFYRIKTYDTAHIPLTGPVLFVSNHQSYLDPIIVGIAVYRRSFHALARTTLFVHPLLGWLIRSLNAIAVERHSADLNAMRLCIDVLQKGRALLIFPEGTRTLDGRTQEFSPGTALLIKRAKPLVVPVGIDGSFDAWPKGRRLPRLIGRIGVTFGKPIPADELLKQDHGQAIQQLRKNVEQLRLLTAARLD